MNRRSFLAAIAALPLVWKLAQAATPAKRIKGYSFHPIERRWMEIFPTHFHGDCFDVEFRERPNEIFTYRRDGKGLVGITRFIIRDAT